MNNHLSTLTRSAQKVRTRERILAAAVDLCGRRGFAATRTADVARVAGVSHGSVFVHYSSRNELLAAVAGSMTREITDSIHALQEKGESLETVLAGHLSCLSDHEERLHWLLREAPALPPEVRVAWVGLLSAVAHHIAPSARRDMRAGRVREMPEHLLLNTWNGLLHHYILHRDLFAPRRSVLRVHGDALLTHFMNLVGALPTPPSEGTHE